MRKGQQIHGRKGVRASFLDGHLKCRGTGAGGVRHPPPHTQKKLRQGPNNVLYVKVPPKI